MRIAPVASGIFESVCEASSIPCDILFFKYRYIFCIYGYDIDGKTTYSSQWFGVSAALASIFDLNVDEHLPPVIDSTTSPPASCFINLTEDAQLTFHTHPAIMY